MVTWSSPAVAMHKKLKITRSGQSIIPEPKALVVRTIFGYDTIAYTIKTEEGDGAALEQAREAFYRWSSLFLERI